MPRTLDAPLEAMIGARLKHFRLRAGMSQSELGNAANLTFQQIQKYENGANRISVSRLLGFSETLGFDLSDFFGELGAFGSKTSGTTDPFVLLSSGGALALLENFARIDDPGVRNRIGDLVAAIAKTGAADDAP